jgi:hypothetical protein
MSRLLVLLISIGGLPAFAQLGGPIVGGADCPVEHINSTGNMHSYWARDCAAPNSVVFVTSGQYVSAPATCNGSVCATPLYGDGANGPQRSSDAPPPIRDLGPADPPWQRWSDFANAAQSAPSGCSPSLSINDIRKLVGSKLIPAKQYEKQFNALVATVPGFLKEFVKLDSAKKQASSTARFSRKFNNVLTVTIPSHDRFTGNPLRMVDLPTQTILQGEFNVEGPRESNKPNTIYKRDPADVKPAKYGIAKVQDGNQTFYFQLTEVDVADRRGRLPVATLRTGLQIDPEGMEINKTGKFIGANCWTHKVEVDGKLFLVTTKDRRKAS